MDSTTLTTASVAKFFRVRLSLPACFLICYCAAIGAEAEDVLGESRQCIVVTTAAWSAPLGLLATFERDGSVAWRQHKSPIPVVVGNAGLAWGRGVVDSAALPGPSKVEGDDRAPAGIFLLRFVFGYAQPQTVHIRMPYVALSQNIVAIDDSRSRYYNQVVDRSKIKDPDWHSAEKMMLNDDRYKWGVFVEHNVPPRPGVPCSCRCRGLCIKNCRRSGICRICNDKDSALRCPGRPSAASLPNRVTCTLAAWVPLAKMIATWRSTPTTLRSSAVDRP